jgi:hypothetical protein
MPWVIVVCICSAEIFHQREQNAVGIPRWQWRSGIQADEQPEATLIECPTGASVES